MPISVPPAPPLALPGAPPSRSVTPVEISGMPVRIPIGDMQPSVVVETVPPLADEPHKERGVVASGERFADSIVAAAGASGADAPLLLIRGDAVPDVTFDALVQLAPARIVVVGGAAVVSGEVEARLARVSPVDRDGRSVATGGSPRSRGRGFSHTGERPGWRQCTAASCSASHVAAISVRRAPER